MPNGITIKNCVPRKPWRGKNVIIKWPGWKHGLTIQIIAKTSDDLSTVTGYEVNWGALGSTDPRMASRYANAITTASVEAQLMNIQYRGGGW